MPERGDGSRRRRRFQNVEMNAFAWQYNLPEWYVPEDLQKY